MKNLTSILSFVSLALVFISCEKEITVDLPEVEAKIVLEGSIDINEPPLIYLTTSQGYFDEFSLTDFADFYISDANVKLIANQDTTTLLPFCLSELPADQQALIAEALGVPLEMIVNSPICVYTTLDPNFFGKVNTVYQVIVDHGKDHLKAVSKLNPPIPLDSIWFDHPGTGSQDSLGFIYATLTDPDTLGNNYRWAAKRISHYPAWVSDPALRGQQKDADFIRPFQSVSNDGFFNGLTFDFSYYRGRADGSEKEDDMNAEAGYYKVGDTIVIRGSSMDNPCYQFIYDLETQLGNQGSPFALPYNFKGNVVGGYGCFVAYGSVYDTLICMP